MIVRPADDDGSTFERLGNAAQIGVQGVADALIPEKRSAVFCGKDQMNVNCGEGLWHGAVGQAEKRACGRNPVGV